MVTATPNTLAGHRDRAIILLGFGAALRRAELVALDVDDLQETDAGLLIHIRRSKGDQEAAGVVVALPYGADLCPIVALRQWLEAARIGTGPVFPPVLRGGHVAASRLTGRSVFNALKQCAARAGLDPCTVSPHGLRAGLLTEAACRGATIPKLLEISRHSQIETLRAYLRPSDLFADHASRGLLWPGQSHWCSYPTLTANQLLYADARGTLDDQATGPRRGRQVHRRLQARDYQKALP